jgi:hypothetical protein
MATGDLLGDDDIDVMLRDLLDEPTVATGWETSQRSRLLAHIAHGDAFTDEESSGNGPARVVVLHQHARTEPAGRSRRLVAGAAAAALVVVGAYATVRLSGDPNSDAPAASDSSSTATGTSPPTTAAIATSNGWPSLLPAIAPAEGETVTASIGEVAVENPRMTTAVVARVDGSSVTDVTHVVAVDTNPYLAAMERFYSAPTAELIGGVRVALYAPKTDNPSASPLAVIPYDDAHSLVVLGEDPLRFLALAGPSFAFVTEDEGSTDLFLTLGLNQLPEGYEVLAGPSPLVPGALQPTLQVRRADGSVVADIGQADAAWPFALDGRNVLRTEDGRYWMSDPRFGSQLTWKVADGQWIIIWNIFGANETPATLEEALAIADRIELVDRDTWLARYPDAVDGGAPATTLAPDDLEAVPVATEAIPVADDTPSARVLVANASNIAGVAGRFTEQLRSDFQTLPAVNSGEPNPRDRSTVYYASGFEEVALALAERIAGADVLPMPEQLPIEGGNDALVAPDIVDGRGAIDILVMLANDHARAIDDSAAP